MPHLSSMRTATMYLTITVVLIVLTVVIWLLGSVGTVRAWHVLALSIFSLLLMAVGILRMPDLRWIVFGLGIWVGIMSLVRSYQYLAVLEVQKQERFQKEMEEVWEKEREADRRSQGR